MIRTCLAKPLLTLLVLAGPALADAAPEPGRSKPPVIGFFDGAKPHCWIRLYDAAHMAAHPKQKVTGIAFAYEPEMTIPGESQKQPMWDQYSDEPGIFAKVVVTLKGDDRPAFASAVCRAGKDKTQLACGVEGDGGNFLLSDAGGVKVRIDNPQGFAAEYISENPDEPDGGIILVDPKDDHDAFVLAAGKGGLCAAEWTTPQ